MDIIQSYYTLTNRNNGAEQMFLFNIVENLNEIKITHYEKIFSHIKQKRADKENIFLSH